MNINPAPQIPNWQYDFTMLDENAIEEEEMLIAEKLKEIITPDKNLRNPGYESRDDNEDSMEEEDMDDDDDDELYYREEIERLQDMGEMDQYDM